MTANKIFRKFLIGEMLEKFLLYYIIIITIRLKKAPVQVYKWHKWRVGSLSLAETFQGAWFLSVVVGRLLPLEAVIVCTQYTYPPLFFSLFLC